MRILLSRGDIMTICISAICTENHKENVVFAVDHMITTGIGQFEHDICKYKLLTDNIVGMLAGNALLMDFFLEDNYSDKSYSEIQFIIEEKFKQKRLETVKNEVLDVFTIDWDDVKEILKNPITNEFQTLILKSIAGKQLDTAILLIGFEDKKAKISQIGYGGIEIYDQIYFNTIGSGSIQAQNTLLFQKQSKQDDLKTTLYNVYKAKRNAEVMQGVGKETDIGFINENGITMLDKESIGILDEIYNVELNYGRDHQKLNDLNI